MSFGRKFAQNVFFYTLDIKKPGIFIKYVKTYPIKSVLL